SPPSGGVSSAPFGGVSGPLGGVPSGPLGGVPSGPLGGVPSGPLGGGAAMRPGGDWSATPRGRSSAAGGRGSWASNRPPARATAPRLLGGAGPPTGRRAGPRGGLLVAASLLEAGDLPAVADTVRQLAFNPPPGAKGPPALDTQRQPAFNPGDTTQQPSLDLPD